MNVFKGLHKGAFKVDGGALLIRGIIHGNLRIDGDADVEMRGMVRGDVLLVTGTLRLPGMVTGSVENRGGTLVLSGLVKGAVTTEAGGTTTREAPAKPSTSNAGLRRS